MSLRTSFYLPVLVLVAHPAVALAEPEPQIQLSLGSQSVSFVRIAPGRFVMGSPTTEPTRNNDETPHSVILSDGFYMAKTPVTVGVWKQFVNATGYRSEAEKGTSGGSGWDGRALVQKPEYNWKNPGFPQTDEHPVTIVTYDDALAFTQWATQRTGRNVTLPTEAQWEYAYRAGTTSTYYDAKAITATALGWFKENAGQGTKPVGQQKANPWGLVDMPGNVWEWCLDWYAAYPTSEVTNPLQNVPDTSEKARRVLRGGSWLKDAKNGRAAARFRSAPGSRNADTGFRLVVLDQPPAIPAATPPPTNDSSPSKPRPVSSTPEPQAAGEPSYGYILFLLPVPLVGGFLFLCAIVYILSRRSKQARGSSGRPGPAFSRSSRGIRLEPANDGFWVDSTPHQSGTRIVVKYYSGGSMRASHTDVVCTGQRQFVYTGHAPTNLTLDDVSTSSTSPQGYHDSSSSSWNSSNNDSYNNSSSSSSFNGYPSAY